MNDRYGIDKERFEKSLEHDVINKFHPPGCDTIKAVMDHEYGHMIDYLLMLRDDPKIKSLRRKAGIGSISENLSRYAATNRAEFVAEAWLTDLL